MRLDARKAQIAHDKEVAEIERKDRQEARDERRVLALEALVRINEVFDV